jgi:hypothetical protein
MPARPSIGILAADGVVPVNTARLHTHLYLLAYQEPIVV